MLLFCWLFEVVSVVCYKGLYGFVELGIKDWSFIIDEFFVCVLTVAVALFFC